MRGPVLDAVGSDVRHVGPSGAGAAVKLANQLMMFSALAGAYEALEFARAYDVDEQVVLDAVSTSAPATRGWRATGASSRVSRAPTTRPAGRRCSTGRGARTCTTWSLAARDVDVDVPVAALLSQMLAARVERK